MEKTIRECFTLGDRDVRTTSALSLAFLGDAVFELVIRTVLVERGGKPGELSRKKGELVNAASQARMAEYLLEHGLLTEEEEAVYRRGRNASPRSVAKSSGVGDYHKATGLECLMGHLYLTGQTKRLVELASLALREETSA